MWEIKYDGDQQNEKYSEFFKCHKCSQWQYSNAIGTQYIGSTHNNSVRDHNFNSIKSEFGFENNHKEQNINNTLYKEGLIIE